MTNSKHMRGVVTSRRDVTDELWVVRVRPEEPIAFRAGQYVTVGLPEAEKLIERPYSVASARMSCQSTSTGSVSSRRTRPHIFAATPS